MADYDRATDPRVLNRSVGSAAGAPKRLYTGSSDAAHEQYPDHQTHYRARSRSRSPSRVHAARHHSQHDYSPHDSHRHSGRNRSRSPDYRHSRHYERHGAPPRELYQISHPRFRGNPQPSMLAPDIPRLGVKNSDHPSIIRDFFCRHPSLYDCEVIVFALRPNDNSMALAENVVSRFTSRNLSTALIHGYIRNEWMTMMNREMHSLGVQFFYLTWAHSAHTNVVTLSERSHDDYRKKPPSWGMYDTVIKGCSSEEAIDQIESKHERERI
ncbi:hypothetical protein GQ42DRAFT_180006 [Ramicandelaber brevisporus]|nr:hypothetical protein GQ42DRAFT_180006 [Ramicandelaber brevisporus]